MRALPQERPAQMTAPPDGQTLEGVIGDLQSTWGVPQYPQEYRITIRVAEERDGRAERPVVVEERSEDDVEELPGSPANVNPAPRREKAPFAPGASTGDERRREKAPGRRRRSRRGRRRGGGESGGATPGPAGPEGSA